ncbi:unnamed protein product [Orchesella dallaii]|uniref:Large ribosomal subunit protein bL28m n=1 Tax=Orchesella dallaii TaxID=48710 RepID=A0ABP1QEX0_9HEXA
MSTVSNGYLAIHPSIRKLLHPSRFKIHRRQWDRAKVAQLPIEYQKFYTEWLDSEEKETPVHWIPRTEKWDRNPETGEVKPVQNEPYIINYPVEMHEGIWGGEGVIQGLVKRGKWTSPVPKYWTPTLKRSIVFSEILDKYFSVVVTERALRLIDEHHGLDSYLITTPAYDLKSLLALKLKRQMLMALLDKNFCHKNPTRQKELMEKFKEYLIPRAELDWYGLSVVEAVEKEKQMKEAKQDCTPLKVKLRQELFQKLKQERDTPSDSQAEGVSATTTSWMSKLNPFSKSAEAR